MTAIDTIYIAKQAEGVASYVVNDGLHRHRIVVNDKIRDARYPTMKEDLREEEVMNLTEYSQIVLSMANSDLASEMAEEFNLFFSENIEAYANNYCVDIVAKHVSKGTGLEYVAMYADVDMDDVYVIGNLKKMFRCWKSHRIVMHSLLLQKKLNKCVKKNIHRLEN